MTAPTVLVRGEARLAAPPDLATLTVGVQAAGRRASDVHDLLARRLDRLRAVLADHQRVIEDSSTTGISVAPTFEEGQFGKPRGYQGSINSTVAVHDFAGLSGLLVDLAEIEQCTVNGPQWSLRPDNPIHRQARLAAVSDARERAEDYAGAFGAQLVSLVEVSDVDGGGYHPGRQMLAMRMGSAQPTLELEPAEQEAVGQILVRFALSEPTDLG